MDISEIKSATTTLVDLAEEAILDYIKKSNLKPGDRLKYDENQLAQQLHVSRNVVREALSRLQSFGIIDSRQRKGILLQEPSMKKNLNKILDPQILNKDRILDLLELRYVLEVGIIPLLFNYIDEEDIKDLQNILPLHVLKSSERISIEHEIAFHSRIYEITKNRAIIDLQETLIPIYNFAYNNYAEFNAYNQKLKRENLKVTHYDIVQALMKKDPVLYGNVIERHLMSYQLYVKDQKKIK